VEGGLAPSFPDLLKVEIEVSPFPSIREEIEEDVILFSLLTVTEVKEVVALFLPSPSRKDAEKILPVFFFFFFFLHFFFLVRGGGTEGFFFFFFSRAIW